MISGECCSCDHGRASKSALGGVEVARPLGGYREIVEGVGQVRMRGTELPFLEGRKAAKVPSR
jgi:hypothetical protein